MSQAVEARPDNGNVFQMFRNLPKEFLEGEVVIEFRQPARVWTGKHSETVRQFRTSLFRSMDGNICYKPPRYKTRGYMVSTGIECDMIERITRIPDRTEAEIKAEKERTVRQLAKRIHPNAWGDVRCRIQADPSQYTHYGLSTVNITDKFPASVIQALTEAFQHKTEYRYKQPGIQRDLSVSTKLCEDGIFRAWYSSEYAGCGNGSYYLLINPTTATFREDD